jgi:Xaa-Pro aminopeptidase
VLFLRDCDPEREVWTGRRLGLARAPAALGVDLALPIGELWGTLLKLLRGYERPWRALADGLARYLGQVKPP